MAWKRDPPVQASRRTLHEPGWYVTRTSLVWLLVLVATCWVVYHWGEAAGILFAGLRCW